MGAHRITGPRLLRPAIAAARDCCGPLYYGPTNRAFASLDQAGQEQMHQELEMLWSRHNRSQDGCTVVDGEYLEVVATRA